MAKTMIASEHPLMTDGQLDVLVDKFRAAARKHRAEFTSEATQQVLGLENLGMELLAPFRARFEAISRFIVRKVKVDRSRTPQQALDATGRKQYITRSVVDAMPRTKTEGIEEVDFYLFRPRPEAIVNGVISCKALEAEFAFNSLKPDPIAQAAFNEQNPEFAHTQPNGTQWRDKDNKFCFAAFFRIGGAPCVNVNRDGSGWDDGWVFGGVR